MSGRKWSLRLRGGRRIRGDGSTTEASRLPLLSSSVVTQESPQPQLRLSSLLRLRVFLMSSRAFPSRSQGVLKTFPQVIYSSKAWFTTLSAEGCFPRRIPSRLGQSEYDTCLFLRSKKLVLCHITVHPRVTCLSNIGWRVHIWVGEALVVYGSTCLARISNLESIAAIVGLAASASFLKHATYIEVTVECGSC